MVLDKRDIEVKEQLEELFSYLDRDEMEYILQCHDCEYCVQTEHEPARRNWECTNTTIIDWSEELQRNDIEVLILDCPYYNYHPEHDIPEELLEEELEEGEY